MPFGYFTCVLRAHFKEVLAVFIIYSVVKKNNAILAIKIWISVWMNDVNHGVVHSTDIFNHVSKQIHVSTCRPI